MTSAHGPRARGVAALLALLTLATAHAAQTLAPRTPLAKEPVRVLVRDVDVPEPHHLVVKLRDALRGRSDARGRLVSRSGADLDGLQRAADALGVSFEPLIRLPESKLAALEARAAERSGRAQPDLAGILRARLADESPAELERVGAALLALDDVEYVHVESVAPPPGDIAPPTPDLTASQTYRGPDPGHDFAYAQSLGLTGAGLRLSDCEYGWNPDHEDLVDRDIGLEPGQTIHPTVYANSWDQHGTAAIGVSASVENGYALDGMVPDCELGTYTEWSVEEGTRRVTAITNAIADSDPGDVVLLEMQTGGFGGFVPAEYSLSVWVVTRAGVDAGVVVVGSAGNGDEDLDDPLYGPYLARGDSGAILVGAGSASTAHSRLSFSTYGSRIDVQSWGTSMLSLGYGSAALYGGDLDQAYVFFSGTSSAGAGAAAVCVAVQQYALELGGAPLEPVALRDLLIQTGLPQSNPSEPIGPFPDLRAALDALAEQLPPPTTTLHDLRGGVGGAGFGAAVAVAGDVDADGADDLIVGAPEDGTAAAGAGAARVVSGATGNELFALYGAAAGDRLGTAVDGAGDVDADGYADVIVGFPGDGVLPGFPGGARVVSGRDRSVLHELAGAAADDDFGRAVAGLGDLDHDGYDDFAVGARSADPNGPESGRATVYSGLDGSVLATVDGAAAGDELGFSLAAAGDVDADGTGDWIVSARLDDTVAVDAGSALVISGADGSTLHTLYGEAEGDRFGWSVGAAGDVDADGYDDLLVGAQTADPSGPSSGRARVFSGLDGSVLLTLDGSEDVELYGSAVAGAGDLDGDGYDDLLVGAKRSDLGGADAGRLSAISGRDGSLLYAFRGDAPSDELGTSLAGAGDFNADGVPDFAAGAPLSDGEGLVRVYSGTRLPLTARRLELSMSAGGTTRFFLEPGAQYELGFYWMFASVTGTSPGLDLGNGVHLPLNYDLLFQLTLTSPGAPAFQGFVAFIDSTGTAEASVTIAPGLDPSLVGLTIHYAYAVAFDFGDTQLASNAVPVTFRP